MNSRIEEPPRPSVEAHTFFFSYVRQHWKPFIFFTSLLWISQTVLELSLVPRYLDFATLIGLIAFWHASNSFRKKAKAVQSNQLQTSPRYPVTYVVIAGIVVAFWLLPSAFDGHFKEVLKDFLSLPFLIFAILFFVIPFLAGPFVDFILFHSVDETISPNDLMREARLRIGIRNWLSLTLTPIVILFAGSFSLQILWRTAFRTFLLNCANQSSETTCASRSPVFLLKEHSSLSPLQLGGVIVVSIALATLPILSKIAVASICKRIVETEQS